MYSPFPLFVVAALSLGLLAVALDPSFRDTTLYASINTASGNIKKYGSPAIVDLDRDGWPDLLFCHHDSTFTELYFNNKDGTFSKAPWGIYHDSHGFSAFPISPWHKTMRFTLSVGGNYGMDPNNPLMFQVDPYNRSVTEVTNYAGITARGGRGRMAVFLDLSMGAHPYWPDVIFTNAYALQGIHQFAYENAGNHRFAVRNLTGGFEWTRNQLATVTDIDNDGVMEVLSYYDLHVWKITAPFHMDDVSASVLPAALPTEGVAAIAEIDFDNDGDFDLYLARDRVGSWMPQGDYHDILLENRNGKYYDVSEKARIPRATQSRGVTAADFNNDGFVDLHISQFTGSDIMLLNNGDGTFRTVNDLTTHASSTRGDHAVAVDYDMDGRVDLVMSEGHHDKLNLGGTFKIFHNNMPINSNSRYINVRVGNPWDRSCTPLNAVVTVKSGNLSMTRRVGSPGTSVSHSYLETLHFGLGSRTMVDVIYVKYTNGYVVMRRNVRHGQTVVMGLL